MNETTSEAPLTATVGERLKDDPHMKEVAEEVRQATGEASAGAAGERQGRRPESAPRRSRSSRRRTPAVVEEAVARAGAQARARKPFPWATLALAAIGWALVSAVGQRARTRALLVGAGARRLAARVRRRG